LVRKLKERERFRKFFNITYADMLSGFLAKKAVKKNEERSLRLLEMQILATN